MNTSKPVEFDGGLFKPSLRQDGVVIDEMKARDYFAEIPEAQNAARNSNILFWSGVVTAGAGGWFLGTWLGGKDHKGENLAASAGFLGLTILLDSFQKAQLGKAADVYNSNLKTKKTSSFEMEPGFVPVAGGGLAGLLIRY